MGAFRSRKDEALDFDVLPPKDASTMPRRLTPARFDYEDAEFEVISNEPVRRQYKVFNDNNQPREYQSREKNFIQNKSANVHGKIETAIISAEFALQRFSKTTFAAVAVLLFMTIFWAAGSLTLATNLPQPAFTPVSAEPLVISKVHLSMHKSNGLNVLQVSAQIKNQSNTVRTLPPLRLDLVPGVRTKVPITIRPAVTSLKPGETTGFTVRYPYSGGKLPEARLAFDAKDAPTL